MNISMNESVGYSKVKYNIDAASSGVIGSSYPDLPYQAILKPTLGPIHPGGCTEA